MGSKTDYICEELESKILSGQWQEGEKIPPFSAMMREFDVSKGMIQYAIGKLASRGFLHTVQGQGTFVGMDKTKELNEVVLLLIKNSEERMFKLNLDLSTRTQNILSGAQREALANNLKLIYSEIDIDDTQQNIEHILSYNSSNILGMVILGYISPELRPVLRKVNYPVILTCDLPDPRQRLIHELNIVTDDLHLSSVIATEKLLAANHRKIGYISSRPIIGWSGLFHAGWKSAIAGAGIEIKPSDAILIDTVNADALYGIGYKLSAELVQKDYTAYFITEEELALGVMEGLMERGVKVPEDISITALSNKILQSKRYDKTISTILSSAYHIGRSAIYQIMDTRKYGANPGRHTIVGVWQDGDTIAPAKTTQLI